MLSAIIITKNEESNIKRCLQSITWIKEIIVLDSGSNDNTINIAKKYTNHIYINTSWLGYGMQKQRALSYATQEWILNIDADEYVSNKLKSEIQLAIKNLYFHAYRIPIKMSFYGKLLRFSCSPRRHIRLFKRYGAKYSHDIIHEKIVIPKKNKIGNLKSYIIHYSFRDINHAIYKINKYSHYSALVLIKNHKSSNWIKSILSSIWMFLRCYILQLGFLDGKIGLLLAIMKSHETFYKKIKSFYL